MNEPLLCVLFGAVCLSTFVVAGCDRKPELIDIGVVPEFSFVDQNGAAIGTSQLKGKPWVASFAFTSCPSSCPPLLRAQSQLQRKVDFWADYDDPPVMFVTITVDPVTDTPERLKTFGNRYNVDDRVWRFARGDYDAMNQLVTKGFMLPLVRNDAVPGKTLASEPTPLDTAHSLRFVLIDADMHIRGLFGKDELSLKQLDAALKYLVSERKNEE